MQRDMKIGMALGVALVGIVGALFFRREPEMKDKETTPPLQSADELDREIAGRPKAPYLKGLEEFDNAAAPVPPPSGPSTNPSGSAPTRSKDDETKQRDTANRKPAGAPVPIQMPKTDALATDQIPAHNRGWVPDGPSGSVGDRAGDRAGKKAGEAPRPSPAGSSVGTNRMHVIQAGETLSALASKYLGSSARYREIYEANRQVLRSPDDVREGLSIVIPDARPAGLQQVADSTGPAQVAPGHSGTKAQKASARTIKPDKDESGAAEPTSDRPREKIRFVPVPRGPFSAGRVTGQGASAKSESRKTAAGVDDAQEENE
jgi:phage tail protein X